MAMTKKNAMIAAEKLIAVFLASKKPTTARAYAADLDDFARATNADSRTAAVADLIRGDLQAAEGIAAVYQSGLRNRYAATTVNRRMATIRSLTRSAQRQGITSFRIRIADLRTTPTRDTAGPGTHAVRMMTAAARDQGGALGVRNVAIISLLYGSGLRVGEVEAIDLADLRTGVEPMTVDIIGKGYNQKERLGLGHKVGAAVDGWARWRGDADGPLFVNLATNGDGAGRLTARSIGRMIKRLGRAVGVETSPHGLRHTAITNAVRTLPLPMVQRFSRHAVLATLQVYYDAEAGDAVEVSNVIMEGM